MAKQFDCRPSELIEIEDNYTAFCFDEACVLIQSKLEDKQKPHFKKQDEENKKTIEHYNSFADMYKKILKR